MLWNENDDMDSSTAIVWQKNGFLYVSQFSELHHYFLNSHLNSVSWKDGYLKLM